VFDIVLRRIRSKTWGVADLKVATLDEVPRSIALSPDGTRLATMAYRWDEVRVFDVKTRAEQRVRAPNVARRSDMILPHALAYSPDSKVLIGIGANDYPVLRKSNGAIVAWDAATGAVNWEAVEPAPLRTWAVSADGRRLATGSMVMGGVQVREVDSGDVLLRLDSVQAFAVALSPDGRTLVTGQGTAGSPEKSILAIRTVDGPGPRVDIATPAVVRRIAFRPDGKAFVTADQNGDLALWVKTGE
jgi:WD40 repeat protein